MSQSQMNHSQMVPSKDPTSIFQPSEVHREHQYWYPGYTVPNPGAPFHGPIAPSTWQQPDNANFQANSANIQSDPTRTINSQVFFPAIFDYAMNSAGIVVSQPSSYEQSSGDALSSFDLGESCSRSILAELNQTSEMKGLEVMDGTQQDWTRPNSPVEQFNFDDSWDSAMPLFGTTRNMARYL
ncbi:hypothetical protein BGZ63DRAFT_397315, partial [Mariannaea sp. PMI_226]